MEICPTKNIFLKSQASMRSGLELELALRRYFVSTVCICSLDKVGSTPLQD